MVTFQSLGLKKEVTDVLAKLKYKEPFEVQEKIIPLAIKGKNIVFTSRTGSGKTIAYLLGNLSKLNRKLGIQMLVIVPTRELCIQVNKELTKICDKLDIKVGALYGGRGLKGDQRTTTRKNQIIIATPGRLMDHLRSRTIKLGEVKYLVFDESDQMFDDGFAGKCSYIKRRVSVEAQILLSSATMTDKVMDFVEKEIDDFELLHVGSQIPTNIVQEKIYVEIPEKNDLLIKFLRKKRFKKVLLFTNTKNKTYLITEHLKDHGYRARSLSSDLKQKEREDLLNQFKQGTVDIMVSTDVAARGLHIENVDMVINYDAPTREEFYVHRIGRTGRVGKKGYAITFICEEDDDRFANIEFEYQLDVKEIIL